MAGLIGVGGRVVAWRVPLEYHRTPAPAPAGERPERTDLDSTALSAEGLTKGYTKASAAAARGLNGCFTRN